MKKKTIIIGIETSCDETAVSILRDNGKNRPKILSNVVSSQFEVHKKFGGVVPDLAARAHLDKIDIMTKKALKISKVKLKDIDAVMESQKDLVEIQHTLKQILCVKG